VRYHQLTGDRTLLEEQFDAAVANFSALEAHVTKDGLSDEIGWGFVDWGYARPEGPIDPAVNLHYLNALRAMLRWCELLKKPADKYAPGEKRIAEVLTNYLGKHPSPGYHVTALALGAGLLANDREAAAIEAMKQHIVSCFPNNADAPRLSDPAMTSPQVITPYFAHFAFPRRIARGQSDFVLDQYRKCWGWMLQDGRTTMLEVFDPRWSHCHQWSACPTWQLSRYALGLHPRFDLAPATFDLDLRPGNLKRAKGRVPMPDGVVEVDWERRDSELRLTLASSRKISVRHTTQIVEVRDKRELTLPLPPFAK
jgi:hypothetical protein